MNPWVKAAVQGAACGLVLGLVLTIGVRVSSSAGVAKAKGFEVVDAAGKMRAALRVDPNGNPSLVFQDAAERFRVILRIHSDRSRSGPGIVGQGRDS